MTFVQAIKNGLIQEIAIEIALGKTPREAFESVIGEGAWEQMAGELYESLRAKAA
jgi:hypothetical protein